MLTSSITKDDVNLALSWAGQRLARPFVNDFIPACRLNSCRRYSLERKTPIGEDTDMETIGTSPERRIRGASEGIFHPRQEFFNQGPSLSSIPT